MLGINAMCNNILKIVFGKFQSNFLFSRAVATLHLFLK